MSFAQAGFALVERALHSLFFDKTPGANGPCRGTRV